MNHVVYYVDEEIKFTYIHDNNINNLSLTVCILYVGLSTESSSDGFIVDNTSPVTVTRIALDNRIGSLKPGTQVLSLNMLSLLQHLHNLLHSLYRCGSHL